MSSYRKNLLVGLVVVLGLVVLAWMIVQFGDAPVRLFKHKQARVEFVASKAEGLSDGSPITFRGVTVGRVGTIRRSADNQSVLIEGYVDTDPPLPGNVRAYIRSSGLIGASGTISLQLPAGEAPQGQLQDGQAIATTFVGLNLLPPEFADLAMELRLTAQHLRQSGLVEDLDETVRKAGQMIESLNQVVGDPDIRDDLKKSLANIRQATDTANRIAANLEKFSGELENIGTATKDTITQARKTVGRAESLIETTEGHIDRLSKQIDDRLVQVAKLLNTFQTISTKIEQGKGTAGAIVNDPRLYESLLLTSQQLNELITDLNRLVEQWEQEGATVRLR